MYEPLLVGLGALIGAVAGPVSTAITNVLNTWHRNRLEARKAKVDEQEKIIDRQEKQIGRHDEQIARKEAEIKEKDQVIEKFTEEIHDYREEVAELRMYIALLREDMIADGKKPRDMPPPRKRSVDTDFLAKETKQNTKINDAIEAKLRGTQPGGTPEK